jgi:hypothetical protein
MANACPDSLGTRGGYKNQIIVRADAVDIEAAKKLDDVLRPENNHLRS